MTFRNCIPGDFDELRVHYMKILQLLCGSDFEKVKTASWIAALENKAQWFNMIHAQPVVIAQMNNKIIGCGSLGPNNNIDVLYAPDDLQQQEAAIRIMQKLENMAPHFNTDKVKYTPAGIL